MSDQKNTTAGDWFFIAGFLIRKAAVITMWLMEGLLKNISIFRRTIIWMIAFTVAVNFGKPAVIGLLIFAVITGIIAWVKLGAVVRSIGNKIGAKNEKVSEFFNKAADVIEKVYPTLRKGVRVFSFVPDFQRFGKLVQRNVALAKGNAFMRKIGAIPAGMGQASRQKYSVYIVKEHNGEIVKDNKDTMGNQVLYFVNERKYPELPLFNNKTFNDIIEAADRHIGSDMTDVEPNSYFMGSPAVRVEFVSNIDNSILKGNQFLKDEGIINEDDNNLYDVAAIEEQDCITIYVNDKISNNVSDTISKFKKAAENSNVKYMNIKQNGSNLVVKYLLNFDPQVDRANDLLCNISVVQKDDKTMYDAYMFDNSVGNPTIVINKQIGYETIESVYNKLVSIRSNYGSKYVDLKDTSSNNPNDPWMTFEYVRQIDKDVERAHDLLKEAKILDKNNAEIYNISLTETPEEANFLIMGKKGVHGVPTSTLIRQLESFKDRFDARTVRTRTLSNGDREIKFIIKDFLDDGKTITEFKPLDLQHMKVECALNAYGDSIYMDFDSKSGGLLGGLPGSGKSAAAAAFSASLAASDDVEFMIIDCKGGDDWVPYANVADAYLKGPVREGEEDNLYAIADFLDEQVKDMSNRFRTNKKVLGNSNFWNASVEERRKANRKFKYIIIDECQNLFGSFAETRNKERKAAFERISKACESLVKEGRSAGCMVWFITQKPTMDAIPPAIRDNLSIAGSLRLRTPEMAKFVFGVSPEGTDPNPAFIPASKPKGAGRAVMKDSEDNFTEVRFYYIPEDTLIKQLNSSEKAKRNIALHGDRTIIVEEDFDEDMEDEDLSTKVDEDDKDKNSDNTRERKTRSTRERSERAEETPYRSAKDGASERNSDREERMRARREASQSVKEERVRVKREQQPVVKLEGQALKKEIVRINHMLRISEDAGASEDERRNAKRMAEKAMERHGITIKELTA